MTFAALVFALSLQTPASPAAAPVQLRTAADSAIEARTTNLARQLRCPVCQGVSIQDSPSELAQQMRALVREQVAAGKTDDEVKAYFIGRYTEWILLQPKASGFNALVYLLPALALVGGGLLIMRAVRKWTAQPAEPTSLN